MSRSGIFQIAFDYHRWYDSSTVKQEPSGTEDTDRLIYEQRLQIEHPDFFCGQGDSPPVGIDNTRPRGAWFLHQRAAMQPEQEQEQPVLQPVAHPVAHPVAQPVAQPETQPAAQPLACSRTPHSLSTGSGGSSGGGGSSNNSQVLPQSHMTWNPVSHGVGGSGDLGSSDTVANASAIDSAQQEHDASGLLGV